MFQQHSSTWELVRNVGAPQPQPRPSEPLSDFQQEPRGLLLTEPRTMGAITWSLQHQLLSSELLFLPLR